MDSRNGNGRAEGEDLPGIPDPKAPFLARGVEVFLAGHLLYHLATHAAAALLADRLNVAFEIGYSRGVDAALAAAERLAVRLASRPPKASAHTSASVPGESAGAAAAQAPPPDMTRHGQACRPSAGLDFSLRPPNPECEVCLGRGVLRCDEDGLRGAAPCKCRNRPVHMDLGGVRLTGFDRMFKTLGELLTPEEVHQPLVRLGPGGDYTREVRP